MRQPSFSLPHSQGVKPRQQLSTSVSQSRNGFWLLMIPWNWNCVSTPEPMMAATWSAAISAAPLPSPTIKDGSTNVASCANDVGPVPPAGFEPVDGSPYRPIEVGPLPPAGFDPVDGSPYRP